MTTPPGNPLLLDEQYETVTVKKLKIGDCFRFDADDMKTRRVVGIEPERAGFSEVVVMYDYVGKKASGGMRLQCDDTVLLLEGDDDVGNV